MQKNKKVKNFMKYIFLGIFLLAMVGLAIAGTPTYTYLSDSTSWFNDKVGIGTDTPTAELEVVGDGTGNGLFIDQDGDGVGLLIDTEATNQTNYGIDVRTGQGADLANFEVSSNQIVRFSGENKARGNWFYRNLNSSETVGPLVFIEQDNSGDDQNALNIQQDGTGASISITQNGNTCELVVDADGSCDSGTAIGTDNSIALCMVCS